MAAVFAFLGMLLLSMVVALLAVLQLGDYFHANDEFILIIAGVMAFTVASQAVFVVTYAAARQTFVLAIVAILLAVLALAPLVLPGLIQKIADRSTNPGTVGIENTYITIELIVPAIAAVLVQWGLARRRWLRSRGVDDMGRWPWITTGVAGLVILNPLGLAFLGTTLKHSPSDFLWEFFATVTAGVLCTLLVAVWIECYIRDRMLRRRAASAVPAAGGQVSR
jgi:hypothetical protein